MLVCDWKSSCYFWLILFLFLFQLIQWTKINFTTVTRLPPWTSIPGATSCWGWPPVSGPYWPWATGPLTSTLTTRRHWRTSASLWSSCWPITAQAHQFRSYMLAGSDTSLWHQPFTHYTPSPSVWSRPATTTSTCLSSSSWLPARRTCSIKQFRAWFWSKLEFYDHLWIYKVCSKLILCTIW